MFKKQILITLSFAVLLAFGCSKSEQGDAPQDKAAVENHDAAKAEHAEHAGHAEEAVAVEGNQAWNKLCPVSGGEVTADVEIVEHGGKNYGFCCPGCDEKFAESPETYVKNLSEDGATFLGKKS